jgi:branched-chain amino acid transport system ATP-binding protein
VTVDSLAGDAVIETEDLTCGYGKLAIVRGLNLTVRRKEVVCLLGANGAGKTTTLLTLAGVLPPLAGRAIVIGQPLGKAEPHKVARRGLAIVPEGRGVFHRLTVAENLRLRIGTGPRSKMDEILEIFPLLGRLLDRRAGLLSGGEQQALGIASALVADPTVIMLDEMSLGLAPKVVEDLLPVVRRLAIERDIGVLLVEQQVGVALAIADRGYVLTHGRVTAQGSGKELRSAVSAIAASYLAASSPDMGSASTDRHR